MIAADLVALEQPLAVVPGLMLCVVFVVLWDANRGATHLLLWGAGFLLGALTLALSPVGGIGPQHGALHIDALSGLSLLGLGFIAAGLIKFTARGFDRRNVAVLAGVIVAFLVATASYWPLAVPLFDLASFGVYSALAWRLLSGDRAERLAGLLFFARGVNVLSLTRLMPGYSFIEWGQVCQYLVLGAGIALLCASFQRASAAAGGSDRLLDIVENVFAQLSTVTERAAVFAQLSSLLYQALDTPLVALYELDRSNRLLRLRGRAGNAPAGAEMPMSSLQEVLGTQRARTGLADEGDPARFRASSAEAQIICFPLAVGARCFGAGFLLLPAPRFVRTQELAAFEAIGRAAGVALAAGEQRDRLRHTASHDLTTGLANRSCLHDAYELRRDQGGLEQGSIVLLIGLPAFRAVNRVHGHYTGDRLLERIARVLEQLCSGRDAVAVRLAGAEFALVFYQQSEAQQAESLASAVHAAFERPIDVDGAALQVGLVIGIAIAPDNGPDDREMIRRAEIAMSNARERGERTLMYDVAQDAALRGAEVRG